MVPPLAGLFFSFWASVVAPNAYILAEQIIYAALILSTVYASNVRHGVIKFNKLTISIFDKIFFLFTALILLAAVNLRIVDPLVAVCIMLLSLARFQSLLYAAYFIRGDRIILASLFQYFPIFFFQALVALLILLGYQGQDVPLLLSGILVGVTGVLLWGGRHALTSGSNGNGISIEGAPYIRLAVLLQQAGKRADALLFSNLSESYAVAYLIAKRLFGLCDIAADYFKFLVERRVAEPAFAKQGAGERAEALRPFRQGVAISALIATFAVVIHLVSISQIGQIWFVLILGAEFFALATFGPIGMMMNYHALAYQRFLLLLPSQIVKIGLMAACLIWEDLGLYFALLFFAVETLTLFIARRKFERMACPV